MIRPWAVLLALVAVYRLTLLDRGALAFVDETFYFTSVMALRSLSAGDMNGIVEALTSARGRSGATLLQLPVAALQALPAQYGVAASNLQSLLIPQVCNVLVTVAAVYFVFAIARALCGDERAAIASAAAYALLVNSNLYVRHLVPYDWALCCGLFSIWLVMTRPASQVRAALAGGLAGTVLVTYAGYYSFAAVVGMALVLETWRVFSLGRAVVDGAIFAAAAMSVVAGVELIFRAGGSSYIGSIADSPRTVVFSSVDDGWLFLPEYLFIVESATGIILLVAALAYLTRAAVRLLRREVRAIDSLMLPALLAWAVQSAAAAQWQAIPLFGRLIHPWMPFLAWMLADTMTAPALRRVQRVLAFAVIAIAVAGAAVWTRQYYRLAYPPTVLYAFGVDTAKLTDDQMPCELNPGTGYQSPTPLDRATGYPYRSANDVVLLNFCQALMSIPRPRVHAQISDASTLIFDGPHWMSFPAYGFEGLIHADRAAMRSQDYRVRIYRLPTPHR